MGREESQQPNVLVVPKIEEVEKVGNVEQLEEEGGGVATVAVSTPVQQQIQQMQKTEQPILSGSGGNSKKRLRTSTVLEEVDKKFLLEQYVSERQKNVNLQLQNRVSQLERELRETERVAQEKEKLHLETLSLAESHHRETVLGEIGRLLEVEFNCSICNEVYIEPAVLNCGHTYCSYCINRALQTDFLCPICRTGYNFNPPAKNIEMRNFINKTFQILPEDMRTTRDQVLQERAALPIPNANENNRNRARRRRSRSISPFDLFGMFNDEDAFRERRSRSRSVSTMSESDDSDDDSAISFFDLRASPRSPSPERPVRSRTRSRSPTASSNRRRRSPGRYGASGIIPLPWRSPLWTSHSPTRTSRYASPALEDRRRPTTNVARRGRPFTSRSFAGPSSGPRRYGWGPPRRQVHPDRDASTNNNNNDTPSPSTNNMGSGNDGGNRRRMSLGLLPYRPFTHRRYGPFGPVRDSLTGSSGRIPLPIPRMVRRPLPLADNFEDLFSRRDPVSNASSAADDIVAPGQQTNHDHSYTSNTASAIVAAITAARANARATTSASSQGTTGNGNAETTNSNDALMSGIERLQEQTRRLYAATSNAAASRSSTGNLSQALALLSPPSASDNPSGPTESSTANDHTATNTVSNGTDVEPRRSTRIARQFRHRFLAPTISNSMYRESERERDRDIERDRAINSQSLGSSGTRTQNYNQESQSGSSVGSGNITSTEATRRSSVDDSPTSSELDAIPIAPLDSSGFSAMRRFVNDLHNYRGTGREPARDLAHRDRRSAAGATSRSSRDNRGPRSGRRSSVELMEEMELF